MLKAERVSFGYLDQTDVLKSVSFKLETGGSLAIIGASGVGKSTLLKILAGELAASAGTVSLDGVRILNQDDTLANEREGIAYIDQENVLVAKTPVRDLLMRKLKEWPERERRKRIEYIAKYFKVSKLLDKRADTMSAGQAQRVNIAAGFLKPRLVVLMDEPFSHQDALHKQFLMCQIKLLAETEGHTLVMTSHVKQEARFMADKALQLHKGRGIFGNWEELMARKSNPFLAAFFGPVSGKAAAFMGSEFYLATAKDAVNEDNVKRRLVRAVGERIVWEVLWLRDGTVQVLEREG